MSPFHHRSARCSATYAQGPTMQTVSHSMSATPTPPTLITRNNSVTSVVITQHFSDHCNHTTFQRQPQSSYSVSLNPDVVTKNLVPFSVIIHVFSYCIVIIIHISTPSTDWCCHSSHFRRWYTFCHVYSCHSLMLLRTFSWNLGGLGKQNNATLFMFLMY